MSTCPHALMTEAERYQESELDNLLDTLNKCLACNDNRIKVKIRIKIMILNHDSNSLKQIFAVYDKRTKKRN